MRKKNIIEGREEEKNRRQKLKINPAFELLKIKYWLNFLNEAFSLKLIYLLSYFCFFLLQHSAIFNLTPFK